MSVLAVAFCPHPPLLLPELAGDARAELDGLRRACDAAVAAIAASGVAIKVVGAGMADQEFGGDATGTFAPWGVARAVGGSDPLVPPVLPMSLTVGAWLLDRAEVSLDRRTYHQLGPAHDGADNPGPVRAQSDPAVGGAGDYALLVMADASASRTIKAPAGFHGHAAAFDLAVVQALRSGEPAALAAAADSAAAEAVGAGGAAIWRTAGGWLADQGTATAEVLAEEAPYGVGYLVALWTWPR